MFDPYECSKLISPLVFIFFGDRITPQMKRFLISHQISFLKLPLIDHNAYMLKCLSNGVSPFLPTAQFVFFHLKLDEMDWQKLLITKHAVYIPLGCFSISNNIVCSSVTCAQYQMSVDYICNTPSGCFLNRYYYVCYESYKNMLKLYKVDMWNIICIFRLHHFSFYKIYLFNYQSKNTVLTLINTKIYFLEKSYQIKNIPHDRFLEFYHNSCPIFSKFSHFHLNYASNGFIL